MSRHIITEEEFLEWAKKDRWFQFAGSGSERSHKTFEWNPYVVSYRVMDHLKVAYEGQDRAAAINAYNAAE